MKNQNHWTKITLRFFGEELDGEKVTAYLGIKPSKIYKKGDFIVPKDPFSASHKTNGWLWEFPCDDTKKPVELAAAFVQHLIPKQKEIQALLEHPEVTGDILVGTGGHAAGCATFNASWELLATISAMKLNLLLDFYP